MSTDVSKQADTSKQAKAKPARKTADASKSKTADKLPNRVWRVTLAVSHEGKQVSWTTECSAPTVKRAVREARSVRRSLSRPGDVFAVVGCVDRDLSRLDPEQA